MNVKVGRGRVKKKGDGHTWRGATGGGACGVGAWRADVWFRPSRGTLPAVAAAQAAQAAHARHVRVVVVVHAARASAAARGRAHPILVVIVGLARVLSGVGAAIDGGGAGRAWVRGRESWQPVSSDQPGGQRGGRRQAGGRAALAARASLANPHAREDDVQAHALGLQVLEVGARGLRLNPASIEH